MATLDRLARLLRPIDMALYRLELALHRIGRMVRGSAPVLPFLALAVGILAFVAVAVWGWSAGVAMMPSYLAAWMVWAGMPFGATLVLLLLSAGGSDGAGGWAAPLRTLALFMPLAALLFIPVLFHLPVLYAWTRGLPTAPPFGQAWLHTGFFIGRAIVYLIIMSGLALLAALPAPGRMSRPLAMFALFIAAITGSLACIDWFMSVDGSFHSDEFGLLIMALMASSAVAVAILRGWLGGLPYARGAALMLALASALWMYLHYMEYLVIWQANMPHEAAWFLTRDAAAGRTIEWLGFLGGFLAPLVLLASPRRVQALFLPLVALIVLVAHMGEALWYITPQYRHHFGFTAPDALLLVAFAGLISGLALLLPLPTPYRPRGLA